MFRKILIAVLLFMLLAVTHGYANQVNAFIYHRFDETRYPSTNISAAVFTEQLEYIKQNDIEVISLREIVARLITEEGLPKHAVAICVDDAFRSFYDVGMPIIRKYEIPVTLFVNTAAIGSNGYLSWDELRELAAEGVEIENHTDSHPYLVEAKEGETFSQWQQRIKADIVKSQQLFEQNLGVLPTLFAYPYGEYSVEAVDIIKELGFSGAYAQQSGVISRFSNLYALPRFPMGGPFATMAGFKSKLKMQPLPVVESIPFDPVVGVNPPELSINLAGKSISPSRFNCFVQGENACWVVGDEEKGDGWYKVVAENPLTGRRNKYTLTVQTNHGAWLWYSHLWVNAKNPAKKY